MKTPPPDREGRRDADDADVRESAAQRPLEFNLVRCAACDYGAKRAEAEIQIDGLGSIDVDYFVPVNGREPFAIARSVRSKFNGAWVRVVRFDDYFAESVRDAIVARLAENIA